MKKLMQQLIMSVFDLRDEAHADVHLTELHKRGWRLVRTRENFACNDCKDMLEPGYMVQDSVWREAIRNKGPARYLCTRCLECRLGRDLTPGDFKRDLPINAMFWRGVKA